ncbi:NYNRIN-like protein [Tanacetum coccineum]
MEFMEKRRKHFAALRAQERRNRPPTKAQKRNQMSIYLKHMGGYKHNQLKGRSYDEIQKLFDKDSAKRAGDKLESNESKKQKTDENEEVEVDIEAELKMHIVIVKDDDIAIDAIPLATKPPMIGIDREDLETLWKLVKTKHGDTRPEDEHERVLWGDLKVMFEPDIKSDVWRNLQGYKVTIWKLFDSCGVHFVRFGNVHIFMLVEKRYPLTPITITNMLNKKLQADYWNEMCYQLLKLMIHMMNIKFRGGLLGLKDFKMILRVTAAQLRNRSRIGINTIKEKEDGPGMGRSCVKGSGRTKESMNLRRGKGCLDKKDFTWIREADKAFEEMKRYIEKLPTLVAPKAGENLIVYLAASKECISAVLMAERGKDQRPIYFVRRVLQGAELNYPVMEKLVLALIHAARRLKRYFQAHNITFLTNKPIRLLLSKPKKSRRVARWAIELVEHKIEFKPRNAVKAQILADFLAETKEEDEETDFKEKQQIEQTIR